MTLTLPREDLHELARLIARELVDNAGCPAFASVADELAKPSDRESRLVDAGTLASALGVSRRFVYEHSDELGAVALGAGARPRLRFDLEVARQRIGCSASKRSPTDLLSNGGQIERGSRRQSADGAARLPKPGSILASRPRKGGARGTQ